MKYIDCYNDNKNKIFSYFYYSTWNNRELSDDLTSETFLKGFEKFDSYNDEFKFSTWIFTIARNILIDYYRKNNIDISLDEISEITHNEFLKIEEDFSEKIDLDLNMLIVREKLYLLNVVIRDIIVMKYLWDYSTKEISNITWKNEANIRKIISRWLKKLKTLLINYI